MTKSEENYSALANRFAILWIGFVRHSDFVIQNGTSRDNETSLKNMDTIRKHASIRSMLKSFAALLLSASAAFAQGNPTAYDALRVVGNQVNRDFVNRVFNGSAEPLLVHLVQEHDLTPEELEEIARLRRQS